MEEIFSNQEMDETSSKMIEIYDALMQDTSNLSNSNVSSDIESTKELAIVKLIDSEDTTQEILSAIKDTEYGKKIQQAFPQTNQVHTIVQRREHNPSQSKRLIMMNGLNDSQELSEPTKFVLYMLDKKSDSPFEIIGEEVVSFSGDVKERCQKVVNLQKANLQEITDRLVKNSF